ncbi:mandelate racemase/muconate lactonizing enzyme family protein [Diaminobutyricibacter sp. McL0618]|uniref:mandelate racemase/muconate lactonizing enzyme family protein n=1 Tax=Leifsonia sp. McL0618 TaxID=3415677 RepID=UPI003CFB8D0D
MRIADIRWHICGAGLRNWVFVEVETDTGLVGVGEATVEGREWTITGHFEDLKRTLIGRSALEVNTLRRALTRDPFWTGGYVAGTGLAGVEIALWDILGKHLGAPVWQLLGGKIREKAKVYGNGWYGGLQEIDEWVSSAGEIVELGYRAIKFDPFGQAEHFPEPDEVDKAIGIVDALRRNLGKHVDLLIEGHGRFDVQSALRIADRLGPYQCLFFEEPLPPNNAEAMARLAARAPMPIAAGERAYSRLDAKPLIDRGAVHVLQPDVVHVGGIAETLAIAAMAETSFIAVAPHNPNGPVATAASLVVDMIAPNFMIQEMMAPWDVPWRHEVVRGGSEVVDGYISPSDRPGLGVELDLVELRKHPFEPLDLAFWSAGSVEEDVDLRNVGADVGISR